MNREHPYINQEREERAGAGAFVAVVAVILWAAIPALVWFTSRH